MARDRLRPIAPDDPPSADHISVDQSLVDLTSGGRISAAHDRLQPIAPDDLPACAIVSRTLIRSWSLGSLIAPDLDRSNFGPVEFRTIRCGLAARCALVAIERAARALAIRAEAATGFRPVGALVAKFTLAGFRAAKAFGPGPVIATLAAWRVAMVLAEGAATDLAGWPWAIAVTATLVTASEGRVT